VGGLTYLFGAVLIREDEREQEIIVDDVLKFTSAEQLLAYLEEFPLGMFDNAIRRLRNVDSRE